MSTRYKIAWLERDRRRQARAKAKAAKANHIKTVSPANPLTDIPSSNTKVPRKKNSSLSKFSGNVSITFTVRQTMERITDTGTGAKLSGIPRDAYSFIHKLIVLSDDERVPTECRTVIRAALRNVDSTKSIKEALISAGNIVNEYWAKKTTKGVTEEQKTSHRKRKRIFENVIFHIREACENNEEVEVPSMRQEERVQAVDTLLRSIESLSTMVRKINSPSKGERESLNDKVNRLQDPGHSGEEPVGSLGKISETFQ
jgi:hypothetical protein